MVEGILQLTEDIHGEADSHNRLLDGMVLISFCLLFSNICSKTCETVGKVLLKLVDLHGLLNSRQVLWMLQEELCQEPWTVSKGWVKSFPCWGMSMCFWQAKKILHCILYTTHQLGARLIDWFLCCGTVWLSDTSFTVGLQVFETKSTRTIFTIVGSCVVVFLLVYYLTK